VRFLAAVLAMTLGAAAPASAAAPLEAYEWRQIRSVTVSALTAGLPAFRAYGGTGVAIDISAVVDISEIADPASRDAERARFTSRLRSYVDAAAASGLTVRALAGSPRWVLPDVRYVNDIVIDYVAAFNAAAPTGRRLTGLALDLEPWATSSWAGAAAKQTRYLLDTLTRAAARAGSLPLTITMPFWLDGTAAPKSLSYGGASMSPTQHVMRILAAAGGPRHSVAVMAYRDTTGGSDGSLAVSAREFDLAAVYGGRVGVVVAQEITDVEPARITFYQEGPGALASAIGVLSGRYSGRQGFAGFAVNDMAALTAKL